MDTRERTEQKSRNFSRERAGHFTIKRRFDPIDYRGISGR